MAEVFKSPHQQMFDAIYAASLQLGFATFDYLPPSSQTLPFVFIGEQFDQDRQTKDVLYGDIQQTIHIYGNHKKRREVTTMVNQLKVAVRSIKRTSNFYVNVKRVTGRTMIDNTTSEPLLHGIIEIDLTFN